MKQDHKDQNCTLGNSKIEKENNYLKNRQLSIEQNPLGHINDSIVPVEAIIEKKILLDKALQRVNEPIHQFEYKKCSETNETYEVHSIYFEVSHLTEENRAQLLNDLKKWHNQYKFKEGF